MGILFIKVFDDLVSFLKDFVELIKHVVDKGKGFINIKYWQKTSNKRESKSNAFPFCYSNNGKTSRILILQYSLCYFLRNRFENGTQ